MILKLFMYRLFCFKKCIKKGAAYNLNKLFKHAENRLNQKLRLKNLIRSIDNL